MRQTRTDDRMDDLAGRVDAGFAQVDKQFEQIRAEFERQRAETNRQFEEHQRQFEEHRAEMARMFEYQRSEFAAAIATVNKRIDLIWIVLLTGACGIIAALLAS